MAYLWIVALGFILCLGIVGSILFFAIKSVVNPQDAAKIDLADSRKKES